MAKGRFVSKQITIDKRVNDLKDPWSMLGFTWTIPHADCEGRLYGDPSVLKSIIFPRQNGLVTIEQVEQMACDWHNAGLIIYYEDDCDRYIQLINFEKHQTGLRKDREPASVIPGFNPDNCRMIDGKKRVKLSQVKLSQVNNGENPASFSEEKENKPEPVLIPCDEDGIPDDWKPKKTSKKEKQPKNTPDQLAMVDAFTKFTGVPFVPFEYKSNNVLWFTPIKSMLYMTKECENPLTEAISIMETAIEKLYKIKYSVSDPNSILKTFKAIITDEHMRRA